MMSYQNINEENKIPQDPEGIEVVYKPTYIVNFAGGK